MVKTLRNIMLEILSYVQNARKRFEFIELEPISAGDKVLSIRNTADTLDQVSITEDGYVKVWDGSTEQNAIRFNPSTGKAELLRSVLKADLEIDSDLTRSIGSSSRRPIIPGAKVTGDLIFTAGISIVGRSYTGTLTAVTETANTLKEEIGPSGNKSILDPRRLLLSASNPTGSLVTLYITIRVLYHDGTEADLDSITVAEGGSVSNTYLESDFSTVIAEAKAITAIRIYAYCSATPAAGYEPSYQITEFRAYQL